jgi:hypothetical protein
MMDSDTAGEKQQKSSDFQMETEGQVIYLRTFWWKETINEFQ